MRLSSSPGKFFTKWRGCRALLAAYFLRISIGGGDVGEVVRRRYTPLMQRGHIHPISSLIREAHSIFNDMGFTLAEGPLIEDEWHNFDALNVPKDHPARDMQDTFFITENSTQLARSRARSSDAGGLSNQSIIKDMPAHVLRTHTSPVQIRYMREQMEKNVAPPYRVIVPGKVFRNEATDMTHEAEFFQIEGFVVGEDVTLAHLKGTLAKFFKKLFKSASVEIRFRPSFFPFTEPSVEVDMRLVGEDVPEKLRDKWIEMMGAGMIHPNVLRNAGVDTRYQGFAFGMGLDRLAMLRWSIDDVRLMHSADLRFINQF